MKPLIFAGLLFLLVFVLTGLSKPKDDPDYSSYERAQTYHKNKQYVLAYKYLIIFKYTNLGKLSRPENKDALEQLDSEITDMETYLSQCTVLIRLSRARGFTPAEVDSAITQNVGGIKLKQIAIQ